MCIITDAERECIRSKCGSARKLLTIHSHEAEQVTSGAKVAVRYLVSWERTTPNDVCREGTTWEDAQTVGHMTNSRDIVLIYDGQHGLNGMTVEKVQGVLDWHHKLDRVATKVDNYIKDTIKNSAVV